MIEEWRDIEGYDHFQVSNFGRVRRLPYTIISKNGVARDQPMKYIKSCDAGKGYRNVGLSKNGKQKTFRLCRVVAKAFCENPNNYPIVNHKDCDVTNDRADNLEWCNHSYNNTYAGASFRRGMLRAKSVNQLSLDGELIKKWDSISNAQRELKIGNIGYVCQGKRSQAGGYKWQYADKK